MPCFGTTSAHEGQRGKARLRRCGVDAARRCRSSSAAVEQHFADIGHDPRTTCRRHLSKTVRRAMRTQVLMDLANQTGGTGHRHGRPLRAGARLGDLQRRPHVHVRRQRLHPQDAGALPGRAMRPTACRRRAVAKCCDDVLDTPVSPELLPPSGRRDRARRPRIWSAPTSCTTFSCTTCCASAIRRARSTALAQR